MTKRLQDGRCVECSDKALHIPEYKEGYLDGVDLETGPGPLA